MTERTFRSPSPGRASTNGMMSPASDVPPVPALPKEMVASGGHGRSASLEPLQRITSPAPANGDRGSSMDRFSLPPPASSRQANRLSNVKEAGAEELGKGSGSPSSRNFSRPMSSAESSPVTPTNTNTAKKYTHGTGSWFTKAAAPDTTQRPKTADGVPNRQPAGPSQQQQYIGPPLNKLKKKKKRVSPAPGSRLAQATQGQSQGQGEVTESVMVYDANSRTFVSRPKERQTAPEPSSPDGDQVFDPNTRSIVSRSRLQPQSTPAPAPAPRPKKERPAVPAVDTTLIPPPRNPARLSPTSSTSPTSPRAAGWLHKQPSIVREDREGEEEAEAEAEAASPVISSLKDTSQRAQTFTTAMAPPPKSYAIPTTHQRSASLDVPRLGDSAGRGRNTSISPQRPFAHFSPSPVMQATRHVPPPRDVSPAKSALKQSPASSLRASSPVAIFASSSAGPRSPPSETSDTTTEDGGSGKKKKGVRVSFDEQPHEIDAPSPTITAASPPADDLEDENVGMRPRPALPSFGSVRRDRAVQPELAEKVTEMPPERNELVGASSDHAIGGILKNSLQGNGERRMMDPLPPEVTSKESAGYVSDESSEADVPAPSHVSAEQAENGHITVMDFADSSPVEHEGAENGDVPAINLLPPTPGFDGEENRELAAQDGGAQAQSSELKVAEKQRKRRSFEVLVPGGWGTDEDQEDESERDESMAEDHPVKIVESPTVEAGPAGSTETARRPSAEDSAATQTVTPLPVSAPSADAHLSTLSDVDEDDSDDEAEFSDAAEELDDEDGGFASLDAILGSPAPVVEQPARPTPSGKAVGEGEDGTKSRQLGSSARAQKAEIAGESSRASGDWSQATAYWSQLSKQQRQQIEREHLSSDDESRPPPSVTVRKPKKKKLVAAKPVATPPPSSQQPAKPAMKKTMRAQSGPSPAADDGVHMRRSMRSGGGGMATSMREGPPPPRPQSAYIEPRGTLQKKNIRPMSSGGLSASSAGAAMQSSRPQSSGGPKKMQDSPFPTLPTMRASAQPQRPEPPQVSARLQRELTGGNDSDSESSFKKRRARGGSMSTMDSQGKYAMRRSMRGGPVSRATAASPEPTSPTTSTGRGRGSFSIRSLSPTGAFFGRSNQNRKETLRQEAGPRTTMRGPPPSRDGARAKGKAVPAPAQRSTGAKSGFKSRFGADSDDEDDARPQQRSFFKSRFADSDDEDEPSSSRVIPADLTPVRGIPRKAGQDDGDSTDLEEEEDDDPRKASRRRDKAPLPMVPDPADVEKAMAAARRNLGIGSKDSAEPVLQHGSETKEGEALLKGSLRKSQPQPIAEETVEAQSKPDDVAFALPERKKRGFMGSILRRNRNSLSSVQQISQQQQQVPASPSVAVAGPASPSSPVSPSVGKLIRRQSDQPRLKRGGSDFSAAMVPLPASAAGSPQVNRQTSDNWPLPPPVPEDVVHDEEQKRPTTSDGISPNAAKMARTMRPDLGQRSVSGQELGSGSGRKVSILTGEEGSEPGEREKDRDRVVYSARTGKKKKFGMLRRAFGLND